MYVIPLLISVDSIPAGAKDVTPNGDVILAFGEVTGHAHRIVQTKERPQVRVWDAAGERFIQRISAEARLQHEEHDTTVLEWPIYRQVYQVEERGAEVRRVAD